MLLTISRSYERVKAGLRCRSGISGSEREGREEQLSKREGEMGEQTYLKMKVLVIIVSQRYMLY